MSLNLKELKEALWMIPLDDLCGIVSCRIVTENRNIKIASGGFRNMIKLTSAYLTDEECGPEANLTRDLADEIEARALLKVKV